ncbi:MAG: DNA cytosine methyltransferase, partial [Patescibacteria group bacterium]
MVSPNLDINILQSDVICSTELGINFLSLFDGMSCAQIALKKAGIKVNKYFASEIDKHAIKVTMANFPNTIQIGDVTNVKGSDLGFIHIIVGGSPCQSFSFAGKRKGMSTKDNIEILTLDHYLDLKRQNFEFEGQSYLFWEYMRILEELRVINPSINFLLENVLMGEKWQKILTRAIGINPIQINSALVSAQNRKRLYWTNINQKPWGLFGDMVSKIQQPQDKKIFLKDVLETHVSDKYYLRDKMLKYFETRSANFNGGKVNVRNEDGKATAILASSASCDISDNFIKVDTNLKLSNNQDKANCFTAGGNSGGLHSDMTLIVASRGRNPQNPKSREVGLNTEQMLEARFDNKTNCLTSVQKDNLVMQLNPSTESNVCQPYQQNRIYDTDGIVKKTNLSGYKNINTAGLKAIKLRDGDDISFVGILPVESKEQIFLATKLG